MPVGLVTSQTGRVTESSPYSYTKTSPDLCALQLTGGHKDTWFRGWCWSKNLLKLSWVWTNSQNSHGPQRWHLPKKLCSISIMSSSKITQTSPKASFVFLKTSGAILKALHSTKASERWCNSLRKRCYLVPHFTPDSSRGHCQTLQVTGSTEAQFRAGQASKLSLSPRTFFSSWLAGGMQKNN